MRGILKAYTIEKLVYFESYAVSSDQATMLVQSTSIYQRSPNSRNFVHIPNVMYANGLEDASKKQDVLLALDQYVTVL
jgi:hypothetical protein